MKSRSPSGSPSAFVLIVAILGVWSCTGASVPEATSREGPPEETSTPPRGAWLGTEPPGAEPALFASGIVSTDLYERDLALSPAGDEIYWTVVAPLSRHSTIVVVRQLDDGTWTEPEIPSLFRGHNSLEPFITVDGTWLWFASTRPLPGEEEAGDWNLWRARRGAGSWGPVEPLPAPINGEGDEFYPSLTRDGTVYFTAEREGGLGGEDLYRSRPQGDGWSPVENLGPMVNSAGPEFNALVHPDGDWILFGSARPGDAGRGDLYLSFAAADGTWGPALALPPPLSSPALDFCPALSPDGRFLFFSSNRELGDPSAATSYGELATLLRRPGNGQSDIYWVDAIVLERLRHPEG